MNWLLTAINLLEKISFDQYLAQNGDVEKDKPCIEPDVYLLVPTVYTCQPPLAKVQ